MCRNQCHQKHRSAPSGKGRQWDKRVVAPFFERLEQDSAPLVSRSQLLQWLREDRGGEESRGSKCFDCFVSPSSTLTLELIKLKPTVAQELLLASVKGLPYIKVSNSLVPRPYPVFQYSCCMRRAWYAKARDCLCHVCGRVELKLRLATTDLPRSFRFSRHFYHRQRKTSEK